MRITSQMLNARVLRDLEATRTTMARTQEQVSSGQRINRPSDDAVGTAQALRGRTALQGLESYRAGTSTATASLDVADDALQDVAKLMARVKELTVQGATGSTTPSGRAAIAAEMDKIIDAVKDAANAKSGDQHVFAGANTTTRPYLQGAVDAYQPTALGLPAGVVAQTIGPGVSVATTSVGSALFGDGGTDGKLLSVLRTIQSNLGSGNVAALGTTDLAALNGQSDVLAGVQATLGATQNRVDAADARLDSLQETTAKLLGDVQSTDYATALTNLNAQSTAYQAALATGAKVIQPSLLDFLR